MEQSPEIAPTRRIISTLLVDQREAIQIAVLLLKVIKEMKGSSRRNKARAVNTLLSKP